MATGKVIKNYNGYYYVAMKTGELWECRLRGKMKGHDRILVGDNVEVTAVEKNIGIIEVLLPRRNRIHRPELANIDQIFIVMAAQSPDPNRFLVDKLLMTCENASIPACLCFNKCDLDKATAEAYQRFYEECGYPVYLFSAQTGEGIEKLFPLLEGKMSAFAGPSGVGKSSLLSCILGRTDLSIGHVSHKIGRGRHTTRHSEIMRLNAYSYVVDTPGFSSLDFEFLEPRELIQLFPDMRNYIGQCRFSSCLHRSEPDCFVKHAVQQGLIKAERYETYIKILDTILERKR